MGRNLTNLYISESFNYLLQISGSEVTNGVGVDVNSLNLAVSSATSASHAAYAITSSLPLQGFVNVTVGTGTLTFTKGDGNETIVPLSLTGSVSSSVSASYAATADELKVVNDNTNNTRYLTYVDVNTGRDNLRTDSGLSYNPSTNILTAGTFSGALSGNATTATSASRATSAASADSATNATSASHAELADLATTATTATNATYAANTIVTGKNVSGSPIAKGTPLYFTGSGTSGNLVGILLADAGNPARMPAGGIAGEAIAAGAEGVVLLDGFINGVDTSLFAPGDEVFVAVGGGYTNSAPTGSANLIQKLGNVEKSAVNGSGVINGPGAVRSVPNIANGSTWVGNSSGVATPTAVSSLSVASAVSSSYVSNQENFAKINQNNTFTGTQTFNNIQVNGTGSFGYIQSVTGSAKIIGDAFIILNNDTPVQNFAGIKVQDSGSATTASLQFDGANNNWFYEYDGGDHNFGVVQFGPEYTDINSPAYNTNNTLVKSNGGHHLEDSNISDNGTLVKIVSNTEITGSVKTSGTLDTAGKITATQLVLTGATGTDLQVTGTGTFTSDIATNAGVQAGTTVKSYLTPATIATINNSTADEIGMTYDAAGWGVSGWTGPAIYLNDPGDTYPTVIGFQNKASWTDGKVTFLTPISASAGITGDITGNLAGNADSATSASYASNALLATSASYATFAATSGDAGSWNGQYTGSAGISGSLNVNGTFLAAYPALPNNSEREIFTYANVVDAKSISYPVARTMMQDYNSPANYDNSFTTEFWDSFSYQYGNEWNVGPRATGGYLQLSGSGNQGLAIFRIRETGTSGVTEGFFYAHNNAVGGNSLNITSTTNLLLSSSTAQIKSNLTITGSIASKVTTVVENPSTYWIMDLNSGSYFDLAIASGSSVFVQAANTKPGQTFILRTTQPLTGSGTVTFDNGQFDFAEGTAPTATAETGSVDIYTFVTFDSSTVYGTQVANLKSIP